MDRPLGALIRGGVRALALIPLLAVLAAAPTRADPLTDNDDPGPALAGTPVVGSADAQNMPTLQTGRYLDTLPKRGEVHYRVPRTESGSTFHVAALFVGAGDSTGEGVRMKLGATPGDQGCGTVGVFRPTLGEPAPVLFATLSTWTDEVGHPCALAEELFLSVVAPNDPADGGRAIELLVYEEPPISTYEFGLLATPEPPIWSPLRPAPTGRDLPFGTTPTNAPVVRDGTYSFTLRPGRTVALAVPLDWDQSLQAQVDAVLPKNAPATDRIRVEIVGPMLGASNVVFTDGPPADWTEGQRKGRFRTGAQSLTVAYANRDSYDSGINTEVLAGVHYVLIHWPGTGGASPAAQELKVPATVTLQTSGVPFDGVPGYTEGNGLIGPQAESRLIDGTLQVRAPEPPRPRREQSSEFVDRETLIMAGGLVGLGALLLLARGVSLLAAKRRRRKAARRLAKRAEKHRRRAEKHRHAGAAHPIAHHDAGGKHSTPVGSGKHRRKH